MAPTQLPSIPAPLAQLPAYLAQHPDKPLAQLFQPYRKFEATVRELYAQEPDHPALQDAFVNVLPVFTTDTPKIQVHARDLAAESEEERAKYIMALPEENRRLGGTMATVPSLKAFQYNFAVFSELSLSEVNWDNIVAAGSSVVNCLMPIPDEYGESKRSMREYYHEKFCPASDVDLFLYGLTEKEATEKIKQIERAVRNSILAETTTVRTKNAITICSQYPTRHVQIVLRIYKSVSEILTGFDIDCSGAAYDGSQVYCTPRALQSYMTQINHIDLTRRSPSYENRLSKYSHRNFEVFWSELDRSRIDPTIFDRSFHRTLGLARLLILERLPTSASRQDYSDQRRHERMRPSVSRWGSQYNGNAFTTMGNIKENFDDEVAEWVSQEDVSNYSTFVIPYGRFYHAKKIEKLCYTRDLLLNAEWNQNKDREVYLHRHPAFFGRAEDVVNDCCGFCPKPKTEQEKEIAKEESKIYISGEMTFIKDDPGRQKIGSFNPLTDDDWTAMAYVGNTARLCQAIVDGDLENVKDWLDQDGADPNRRDYTGRTPLHLAVRCSTPEIVQCLVDKGARLIARLADGKTALHLAAERGSVEIVKILMDKSTANEAEEEEKKDLKRRAKKMEAQKTQGTDEGVSADDDDEDDGELVGEVSDGGTLAATEGSFMKVEGKKGSEEPLSLDDDAEVSDVYDVDVIAWDRPCSAVHFAIMAGHDKVVKLLCEEYGASVLLPIKYFDTDGSPSAAILTLVLAMTLPVDKAKSMVTTLLGLGATSSQGDMNGVTPLFSFAGSAKVDLLETLLEHDKTGSSRAIDHISFPAGNSWSNPLLAAIGVGDAKTVSKLLDAGAVPNISIDSWLKSAKSVSSMSRMIQFENTETLFRTTTDQPLIAALRGPNVSIALDLLERGADPNTETKEWYTYSNQDVRWRRPANSPPRSALALARNYIGVLKGYDGEKTTESRPLKLFEGADSYLDSLERDSWFFWAASVDVLDEKKKYNDQLAKYEGELERVKSAKGVAEKTAAISEAIAVLERIEQKLVVMLGKDPDEKDEPEIQDRLKAAPVEFTKTYEFVPRFVTGKLTTETEDKAYVLLFEAAWRGDLATIKKLTLAAWRDANGVLQPPLLASASYHGHSTNSPFSLAFLRGHYKVARAILEIMQAQYSEDEKERVHYFPRDDGDGSNNDDIVVRAAMDNGKFTIENIGESYMQVYGKVKPLGALTVGCTPLVVGGSETAGANLAVRPLLQTVFANNDRQGLRFLLDTATYFCGQKLGSSDVEFGLQASSIFERNLVYVLDHGHTEMLAEMIKRTGVGLPLERMVKDAGVETVAPPRYYQGLTVYGKKRSDWADAGRTVVWQPTGSEMSPLMLAVIHGCLEMVEWFLSDAPLRCYLEFTQSERVRDDVQVRRLGEAPGGFEGAISRWLEKDRELVLCAAAECIGDDRALSLVKYLVKAVPEAVTARNAEGMTPLMLACQTGRAALVRPLIEHGADPTERRQDTFENLLHVTLAEKPRAEQLRQMLDAIGPEALARMFCERSHHTSGSMGRTPLYHWLIGCVQLKQRNGAPKGYDDLDQVLDVLRLLLSCSGGRELGQVDSLGNTLLHSLVAMETDPRILDTLLAADPRQQQALLLCRENAVGLTPPELCWDWFLSQTVVDPGRRWAHMRHSVLSWPQLAPRKFCDMARQPLTTRKADAELLHAVEELMRRHPGKRKLVSLLEAEDVTKRIDGEQAKKRHPIKVRVLASEAAAGETAQDRQGADRMDRMDRKDKMAIRRAVRRARRNGY